MKILSPETTIKQMKASAYSTYAVTIDNSTLCGECVNDNHEALHEAHEYAEAHGITMGTSDGSELIQAIAVNYEDVLYCDSCGDGIEPEYSLR